MPLRFSDLSQVFDFSFADIVSPVDHKYNKINISYKPLNQEGVFNTFLLLLYLNLHKKNRSIILENPFIYGSLEFVHLF